LRKPLDQPISPEMKRRIVEALVQRIQTDTVERWSGQLSEITITYRFRRRHEVVSRAIGINEHSVRRAR
jgi:hypothetical protein